MEKHIQDLKAFAEKYRIADHNLSVKCGQEELDPIACTVFVMK